MSQIVDVIIEYNVTKKMTKKLKLSREYVDKINKLNETDKARFIHEIKQLVSDGETITIRNGSIQPNIFIFS